MYPCQNMYRSNFLISLYNFSHVSKRLKSNSHIGKVIKNINKENKSLFGELLETLPQKRRRESKKTQTNSTGITPSSNSKLNENDISSEVYWYSHNLPSSHVIRTRRVTNISRVLSEFDKINKVPESIEQTSDEKNTSKCKVKEILSNEISSSVIRSYKDDASNNCSDELIKVSKKKYTLQLPDVIIRNIPSFPLQNERMSVTDNDVSNNIVSIGLPLNSEDNCVSYPSVSKILNATMSDSSRVALKRWRQKMILELGEEGFLIHHRGLLERGSQFHCLIQNFLSGCSESELKLDQVEGCWESVKTIITDVTDVKVLESHVVHSKLLYRGVIDCVASYKGRPVLIEWKKSDKQKSEIEKTYDAPLQLCAYIGAMNYDTKYSLQVQGGLVVVAYSDGSPAHIFKMNMSDCLKYWRLWLHRLHKYWNDQQLAAGDCLKQM
ncbi:hypothetical protein C0J52_14173 [Blattella germanica]|nr:hypothetical protein C0J52_14173 [Blattella germanica]